MFARLTTLAFLVVTLIAEAHAQLSITTPNSAQKIASCDDYATIELNDPWDMSSSSDINNFTPSDVLHLTSNGFSNGTWSMLTDSGSNASFYLISPIICGAYQSGGRYGVDYPIDTAKYTRLSIRMYTDAVSGGGGIKLLWNRACGYAEDRTVTSITTVQTGWHVYTIDLSSIGISSSESSNTAAWSSGSIKGLALQLAGMNGANVEIDWIRLEDPTTCGSYTANYSATATGGNGYVSLYLDNDANPFNGYKQKLVNSTAAAGASTAAVSSLAVGGGSYYVTGLLDGDYATLERDDAWDMNESTDILTTSGISGGAVSGGLFSGTTTSSSSSIYFRMGDNGLTASVFNKLSYKLTQSTATPMILFWTKSDGSSGAGKVIFPADSIGGDIYNVDLSGEATWSGTITEVILRPTNASAVTFSLDFLSLRNSTYETSRDSASLVNQVVSSSSTLTINSAPLIEILQPDNRGGVAYRPWNMNSGDFVQFSNLRGDSDPDHSGENYSTYLPDVRTVEGVRGDLFKGTNELGDDDPNNYLNFPIADGNPGTIDGDRYKNLCFKMLIDNDFDLCLGSVARVIWANSGGAFVVSNDLVTIYDRWSGSRWYEYCADMSTLQHDDEANTGWSGTIESFRVDSNEFSRAECGTGSPSGALTSTSYYFDYIKLRTDDTAHNQFNIVFRLSDSDDDATVSFYYATSETTSGGTLIGNADEDDSFLTWDTSNVPNGTYYVYAVATDTRNTVRRVASGRLVVDNATTASTTDPVLSLDSPVASQTVCGEMQIKGYALEQDRYEDVAGVEVRVDGTLFALVEPGNYSGAAKAAYPSLDASNAGFNASFDASGLSAGSHTVQVKALSTSGRSTSQSFSITKQSSGCSDPIADADPAGTPVSIPEIGTTTPTVTTPTISTAKLTKKGVFTMVVANAAESGMSCTVQVNLGSKKSAVSTQAKSFTTSSSSLTLSATKFHVNKSKLKRFFVNVSKECSGYTGASSSAKQVKASATKGVKTIAAVAKKLGQRLQSQ